MRKEKKIVLYSFFALLLVAIEVKPQKKNKVIEPLKIGEKIPDELWNIDFKVVNHPEKKESITLKEYRGKLIILDFWATWCTSCIKELPKLKALKNQFYDNIIILSQTDQSKATVESFIKVNETARQVELSSIVEDNFLNKVFPHRVLPHYVWISPQGTFLATSSAEQVNAENINMAVDGEKFKIVNKIDINPDIPLFMRSDLQENELISYSILSKGMYAGLSSGNRYRKIGEVLRGRAMTNTSLKTIYRIVAREIFKQRKLPFNENTIIVETKNINALNDIYNYELVVPLSRASMLYEAMLIDLNNNSNFEVKIEKRQQNYVLVIYDKIKKAL